MFNIKMWQQGNFAEDTHFPVTCERKLTQN